MERMNPIEQYRKAHPENTVWSPDKGWHDNEMENEIESWSVVATGPDQHVEDFTTYADAVAYVNQLCDELETDGYQVDRSWASSGNYFAAHVTKFNQEYFISVERDEQ